jgi:hypothetical protein
MEFDDDVNFCSGTLVPWRDSPRWAGTTPHLQFKQYRHRAVIDQFNLHMRAERACLYMRP